MKNRPTYIEFLTGHKPLLSHTSGVVFYLSSLIWFAPMGLDLTIIPDLFYDSTINFCGTHRLQFERDSKLFERIKMLKSEPLPPGRSISLGSYEDGELIFYTHDGLGEPLRQVRAGEISREESYWYLPREQAINKAIFAYLRSLPPQIPVVLYWH